MEQVKIAFITFNMLKLRELNSSEQVKIVNLLLNMPK